MSQSLNLFAVDLGASSGRTILGKLQKDRIEITELTRFYNEVLDIRGRLHWDVYRLFEEMKNGLKQCAHKEKIEVHGLGIDTWGVDFGLFSKDGTLLGAPYAYRDSMTNGIFDKTFNTIQKERLYALTGIQFMQFNSVFQLHALKLAQSPLLEIAHSLLFIPDIFNYWFTGVMRNEFTFSTTSQMLNPHKNNWEDEIFITLGLPRSIMQAIAFPGSTIGQLDPNICKETGINSFPVMAVASHDTGSAIAAIPAEGNNWAYISSGTWSLMGIESKAPIINEKSAHYNFTNEGGVEGTYRVLKNISGLYLLEQCKRSWALKGKDYSYEELVEMAKSSEAFAFFLDPDASDFNAPKDMPAAIEAYFEKTGQGKASTQQIVRAIFDSLSMRYKQVFLMLKELSEHSLDKIHIIGGGSRNEFLCQLTSDACGVEVEAGPAEGTAIGNLIVQGIGLGAISNLAAARRIVKNSITTKTYTPKDAGKWDQSYQKYLSKITK